MTLNRPVFFITVLAGFLPAANVQIARGQAAAAPTNSSPAPAAIAPLSWPPTLDVQNTTTVSVDGRKIERFIHGGRPEWGYPANAAWPYPPLEKFESTMQNNNCFYLVSPKVPRDNAPLCVVLHSANRSGFDYMHYSSLTPGMTPANPSKAITDSPDDFYALYLNSTNDEWWGWHQAQASADFAKHVNTPSPAERRMLDTIEWVVQRYHIDRNRIYLTGMSMGGCGTLGIGLAHGDIFAAALTSAPAGTEYAAYRTNDFKFGAGEADPPVMVDFSSPPDGWSATQPALLQAAQTLHLPLVLSWGPFGHVGDKSLIAKYPICAVTLAFPYQEIRKNEAYPVFTHASTDQVSPWLNAPAKFDESGQINAWFRWKDETDTPDQFTMQVSIAHPAHIDPALKLPDTATADVTLRRLQQFKIQPAKSYSWQETRAGQVVASGKVMPDAANLLTIPQVTLGTTPADLSLRADQ
jgi:predicted esterase